MIVLHPYLPGCREEDQAPTWRLIEQASKRWPVHDVDLSWDPLYGYGASLRALWDGDRDWLIIEHDVEATIEDIKAMEDCPELLCMASYGHSGHAAADLTSTLVVCSSLGFTRITARARQLCGDWPVPAGTSYHMLDSWLTGALAAALVTRTGRAWHAHRPVLHHHSADMV
jgi:hypothetical protein